MHEPDWFVSYWDFKGEENTELHSKLLTYLRTLFPFRNVNVQKGSFFENHDNTSHTLHLVEDNILRENHLLCHRILPIANELLGVALFGQIYPGQEEHYQQNIDLIEEEVEIGTESFWRNQFNIDPFSSIINLTTYGINAYKVVDGGFGLLTGFDHFDIVLVDSLSDICLYWNIRALREVVYFKKNAGVERRTLCLPLKLLEKVSSLKIAFKLIKEKLFFPGRQANLDLRFYASGKELADRVRVVFNNLEMLEPFNEETIHGNPIRFGGDEKVADKDIVDRPLSYMFCSIASPRAYFEGVSGSTSSLISLNHGGNEFRIDPPSSFYNRHSGTVALDLECDVWKRFPKCHRVAEAIEKNSWFSRYGLSMAIGLSSRPHFRTINLPQERESLRLYFEGKGFKSRTSKVEQYSNAVVDLVGGLSNLKLLATKPAYQLLNILAQKSTKKIAQRIVNSLGLENTNIDEITHIFQDLEVPPELKKIPRTFGELRDDQRLDLRSHALLKLLDELVTAQVLKRGFNISCPNCGVPNWYPLETISEYLTCPGCSHRFILPVREPDKSNIEMQWRYRLNTLVNRAVDQDVLVGLLALHHLSEKKTTSCQVFGLELRQDDKPITDFDFLFVSDQKLYAGECKAGSQLAPKDFETAKLAAKLGFAEFYFCTVAEFADEVLNEIEQLQLELSNFQSKTKIYTLSGSDLLKDLS
ncbi:hypothetical protein [Candidatus Leptofilum sp.]|uniref:hypothetical protein n=1 Tax=Candidatus Leptofilum sp. TaxID=3241576 RepID=UPI003B5C3F55